MTVACFVSDAVTRILRAKHLPLFLFLLVILLVGGPQHSFAQNCGGAHQRACCVGEGVPCQSGKTEVVGCPAQDSQFSGGCACTILIAGNWVDSGSQTFNSCEDLSNNPCGGEGQRSCCVDDSGGAGCNGGRVIVPGCTGDNCFCPSGALSSGT